ncbi:hypothetical protein L9F63_021476, partial [Diploptera punctata]
IEYLNMIVNPISQILTILRRKRLVLSDVIYCHEHIVANTSFMSHAKMVFTPFALVPGETAENPGRNSR